MVNRLSAHIFHNGDQTAIDSRKIQIFCHKKQRLRLRIILKKSNVKRRARRDFTFNLHDLRRQLDVNTATGMELKTPKQKRLNNLHSPVLHVRPEKNKLSFLQQSRIFIILMCKLENNICIVDVTPC